MVEDGGRVACALFDLLIPLLAMDEISAQLSVSISTAVEL